MALENSGGMKEKEELKTQLAFLCASADEKVVVAAMRDYLEEYGWVLVSESRFKKLTRTSSTHTSMCEQMMGTLPAVTTELNQIKEIITIRIKAVERLTTMALEPVFSEKIKE
jgi:hypothetical protein